MNPHPPKSPASRESDNDDADQAGQYSNKRPPAPTRSSAGSAGRPTLMRSPPGRLSQITRSPDEGERCPSTATDQGAAGDGANESEVARQAGKTTGNDKQKGRAQDASTAEGDIAKLRDAVNARLMMQQRQRSSYGSAGSGHTTRVSPIKEEDSATMSPSLTAAFASPGDVPPVKTSSSMSTESTESAKTIRGSVPGTPAANAPLRTPSYPFPYVPGTPRSWPSQFHQPFTNLSPTVTARPSGDRDTPGASSGLMSGGTTPGAAAAAFMPGSATFQPSEDPRYPTPNIYDMVLRLNCEPGLEAWWAMVTNLMHDDYKAERVTLVMPADPTDIENVPWGQKATFSMNGPEEFVPPRYTSDQRSTRPQPVRPDLTLREPSTEMSDVSPQKLHPERLRPGLQARHSYAGHGRPPARDVSNEVSEKSAARPLGPQRMATHHVGMKGDAPPATNLTRMLPSQQSIRHTSLSDPEFSTVAGERDAGPYAEMFSSLRALNHETRPLIEPSGVNRVLERGRVVTVTRDYVAESSDSSNGTSSAGGGSDAGLTDASRRSELDAKQPFFSNYRGVFTAENRLEMRRDYEEYEQQPASPWAQSPAPSPAIQADEERNPFFASEEQHVEESFNPEGTPKDYSQYGQVEAIGIDRASTVIHVPLVHPTLSQPMQSLRMSTQQEESSEIPPRNDTLDYERRAPIAVLSILSSTVPYPQNLTHSLKLLGPHLATSFATSQQFSTASQQQLSIRHRRTTSGHPASSAPMTIEPTTLDDIVNAELGEPSGSMSGSITSPSDYSGKSRYSPNNSLVGTPGWDPASYGWTRSVTGTPANNTSEMVDSYFDAKKRTGQRPASGTAPGSSAAQVTPAKQARRAPSQEDSSRANKQSSEEPFRAQGSERKTRTLSYSKEENASLRNVLATENSPTQAAESGHPSKSAMRQTMLPASAANDHKHSLLHSYGADYATSFGSVPNPNVAPLASPRTVHGRKSSHSESTDMPPPSERLLRTIIDSLPVQIFTAAPETGKMTWVNSKFLIYRGQESRQVLSEPWEAIHPEDRDEYMNSWNRSLRTGQQLQQKVRLQRFDGSYRWFYVRAAPLKDKRQHIVHWIGTNMDFHEQHIAETNSARQQETAASEAKYRALANSSPQIVFAVNKSGGITFCNTQWFYYSGQTEAEALGTGFMDYVHPDDLVKCRLPSFQDGSNEATNVPTSIPTELRRRKSLSQASSSGSSETEKGAMSSSDSSSSPSVQMPQRKLSELASTGILKVSRDADGRPSYSTEVRLKSKEGEFRWHLVRVLLAEPLVQAHNEEETWYGTCTDINDHKTLERDLKETMDEKSRFLSNMSHEIRTPLNGITGMVNFLIDSSLSSEQMEHVNIIRASTEGLRGLINDILDLSKAEAGMIQLNMDWLHVRSLIEEVNDLTSAMAIDKGLELNYLVDEDVPAMIKGDRFRIRQILLNVIGNAIKFTIEGEVFVRCSTFTDEDEPPSKREICIKFEVIDTGRGFTDREAQHLFKRFSQIDGSSTRQHGGTGLGLVISRQLAQLHGGDMSAKGVPGKGATFTFLIKTALPSKTDMPPKPPPTPGPGAMLDTPATVPAIPPITGGKIPTPPGITSRAASLSSQSPGNEQISPRTIDEQLIRTASPSIASPDAARGSPAMSSASSDPSVRSLARTSIRSERSSASSLQVEATVANPPMKLSLPSSPRLSQSETPGSLSTGSIESGTSQDTVRPLSPKEGKVLSPGGSSLVPPMYSILVVCPLRYSRDATVQHIEKTLPKSIPHQITARETLAECQDMIGGEDPVVFSHVVVVLQDVREIAALMDKLLSSPSHSTTTIVIITDLSQRRRIMEQASSKHDYDALIDIRRLRFVFKPLKPSRFAVIFDPRKEREMSTDRNQDSAQQVATSQKQVFDELTLRLRDKGKRVLLVEDNKVNQMVILKFLSKVSIPVETALDGVQCTDKVFSHPHDYYSIILCDLHMPNKDGYQTCKEIRSRERAENYAHAPIIALSANVLGDVYQKCVEAGFNSYMTKPVDFKELSNVLMRFMDPVEPGKPHEFMKAAKRGSHKGSGGKKGAGSS
ncbi:hypothetical protein MBLNU230_g0905t1 [Neophaeotheca triangularis]